MKPNKLFLTIVIALISPIILSAYDFEVDGICYNNIGRGNVEVTYTGLYNNYGWRGYSGNINIPQMVEYQGMLFYVTQIGSEAFSICPELISINIPNSITVINDIFSHSPKLTSINIDSGNSVYDSRDNCNAIIETATNKLIVGCKNTIIPKSVTAIGKSAFCGCTDLTSISIPNSVTEIGEGAFYNCSGLTSISIPNSVTEIEERAFYNCSGLTSIKIPNSVIKIKDDVFNGCSNLAKLTIEDGTDSLLLGYNFNDSNKIGKGLFNDCPLSSLYLGRNLSLIKLRSTTTTTYAPFNFIETMNEVTIGNSVTSIVKNLFNGCSGLTEVNISNLYNWYNLNFESEFSNPLYYAHKLKLNGSEIKELIIPNSVANIKQYAFINCENLTAVSIGNSVTEIGTSAFEGCKGVTSVTIPRSVNKINNKAFYNCAIRLIIAYPMTPPTCADGAFNGSYSALLKVPEGTDVKYAVANEWHKFDKIQEIAGVENVMIDNVAEKIAIENGNITINGIENPQVEVYSLNGNCIYCGNDTIIPISTGVYILRINGKSYKIAIK